MSMVSSRADGFERKAKEGTTLHTTRYASFKSPGVCAYPGMEQLLYEKFLAKRGNGGILRNHSQCLIATSFGFQLAGSQPFYHGGVYPCEWEPI